jgi:nucleolar complex protein 3
MTVSKILDTRGDPCEDRVPLWERGNAARKFAVVPRVRVGLPTVSLDGDVRFPAHRSLVFSPTRKQAEKSTLAVLERVNTMEQAGLPRKRSKILSKRSELGPGLSKKRHQPESVRRSASAVRTESEQFERAKGLIAGMASAVVADPEANITRLSDLRRMAKASNRSIAALIVLTESQLYKDVCPSYRIRPVSEEESKTKVSKDVARMRNFEQTLLASYTRFLESAISHSRWRAGGSKPSLRADIGARSDTERNMQKLRRAACTALIEVARSLLHFNLAEQVAPVVAGFATDWDPEVRKEAAVALSEVLGEAHRCGGSSLSSRVLIGEALSKAVINRKASTPPEALSPFLSINFPFFSRLGSSHGVKNDVNKPFNRKNRKKVSGREADRAAKEASEQEHRERRDLERDLREAHAEASPQELFGAKKRLLHAVCIAYFNVIKAASEVVVSEEVGKLARHAAEQHSMSERNGVKRHTHRSGDSCHSQVRRPPPALAEALEGTLCVATMLPGELLDAILAALAPLLEGDRLPLHTRFRCLTTAYSILSTHALAQGADADSFTRDARAMDVCLYTSLGRLYGPLMPLSSEESVTTEALRAVAAALDGRQLPRVRAAALARRLGVLAAAKAPTHACAIGLASAMQRLLAKELSACLFAADATGQGLEISEHGRERWSLPAYDEDLDDPDIAGADHSTSWELVALASHFHPTVRSIVLSCGRGVCGDRMPSGPSDVSSLVSVHTSRACGFNPAPATVCNGKKNMAPTPFQRHVVLSEKLDLDLDVDSEFPEIALWHAWNLDMSGTG